MSEESPESVLPETNPLVDNVEVNIVKDAVSYCIVMSIIAAIILGFAVSLNASWSALLAGGVVLLNMYIAAAFMRAFSRISPQAIMVGALGSFVIRLLVIFLFALAVQNFAIFDFTVWLLSVAIGHVGLLAWETLRVSKTVPHH